MKVDPNDPQVDVSADIPRQPGLAFDVRLNLQNEDELHLAAGEVFWASWFPSSDPKIREQYRNAVTGLLAGSHRIVEYRRLGSPVVAELQSRGGHGWETLAKSSCGFLPLKWATRKCILRNDIAAKTLGLD